MIGAQKCTVFGPTGEFKNLERPLVGSPLAAGEASTLAGFSAADWYVRRWAKREALLRRTGARMARKPRREAMKGVVIVAVEVTVRRR